MISVTRERIVIQEKWIAYARRSHHTLANYLYVYFLINWPVESQRTIKQHFHHRFVMHSKRTRYKCFVFNKRGPKKLRLLTMTTTMNEYNALRFVHFNFIVLILLVRSSLKWYYQSRSSLLSSAYRCVRPKYTCYAVHFSVQRDQIFDLCIHLASVELMEF